MWVITRFIYRIILPILMVFAPFMALHAEEDVQEMDELQLFFEEHELIEITSVNKKAQKLTDIPAAVFVITQEDIRRSTATSIPELLRMVPGVQVARLDANKWAISARGFNERFANKLLVLIDGRSVYTPFFAGTYWDKQDTLLEDVERIEVVRGPGATVWGANAVNGVINIITKSSADTQGGIAKVIAGNEERGLGALRYGGKLGDKGHYRTYIQYADRDAGAVGDDDGNDEWDMGRVGFRMDWNVNKQDSITLQGEYNDGTASERLNPFPEIPNVLVAGDSDTKITGSNILLRWTHQYDNGSQSTLQTYYDHIERDAAAFGEKRDIIDLEFQYQFDIGSRHEAILGVGYRRTSDDIENSSTFWLDPDSRADDLYSAFIQDEISLVEDKLNLTLGSKFEENDYTGTEIQPGVRLAWTIDPQHTLWTSVARAVRTPARVEHDVRFIRQSVGGPAVITIEGDDDYESEELLAYELGYRFYPSTNMSVDIAAFYNDYDNLRTLENGGAGVGFGFEPSPTTFKVPIHLDNKLSGKASGIELASNWQVQDDWRLTLAYSLLEMKLELDDDSTDIGEKADEDDNPRNQLSIRSLMALTKNLELDVTIRYADKIKRSDIVPRDIPSYTAFDIRIGWRPNDDWELSLAGQNLFDPMHPEFSPNTIDTEATEVERSIYGKVIRRF